MRKVEKDIVSIVKDLRARKVTGKCQRTKRDCIASQNGSVCVALWGTAIATITDEDMIMNSGGYRSVTTKSRLNALLQGMGSNWRIYQENFVWWMRHTKLDARIEFHDGISVPLF